MAQKYLKVIEALGSSNVKLNEPLSKHTTFHIGGPADLFYEANKEKELIKAVGSAYRFKIPLFILGNGSNVLVSNSGFRGLVVKNSVAGIKMVRKLKRGKLVQQVEIVPYGAAEPKKYLQVSDLDYPDEPLDTEIEVMSGTPLQALISWTLKNNLTGLQWFVGIPGSVGGAVVHNAHGMTKLFSNYVQKIKIINQNNRVEEIERPKIKFGYDFSDVLKISLIILRVNLLLASGDISRAKSTCKEWWRRKRQTQPQTNCPGSIFKNISSGQAEKANIPTPSVAWIIDHLCSLKGRQIGKAQISPRHSNFIINLGGATAQDVISLIKLVKEKVREKTGIVLEEEIYLLGFDKIKK